MKNILKIVCSSVVLASLSVGVFAGEYADLNFIGFSKDGKYLAFEESGRWDPSDALFSNTYFINVDDNSYALPPVRIDDFVEPWADRNPFAARDRKLRALTAANLRKLKIVTGDRGTLVVSHLLTDWSFEKPVMEDSSTINPDRTLGPPVKAPNYEGAFFWSYDPIQKVIFNDYLNPNSANTGEYYELTLKSIEVEAPESNRSGGTYKFELTLDDRTRHELLETQVLQKDSILPAARKFPYGYRIERVYVKGKKIAVFLNVFNHGFEGVSMRYMVVTGEFR